jgi:hypothetical protein
MTSGPSYGRWQTHTDDIAHGIDVVSGHALRYPSGGQGFYQEKVNDTQH